MTEYIAAGSFFLALVIATAIIYLAYYSARKRRYKRNLNNLIKVHNRMKKVENHAIFVALSEVYKK